MVDTDNSEALEFEEIILYLEILIKGKIEDKIGFIFDFIVYPQKKNTGTKNDFHNFFKLQLEEEYSQCSKDEIKIEVQNLTNLAFNTMCK